MASPTVFSFSPLPDPRQVSKPDGPALSVDSFAKSRYLQQRYAQLPTPEQLVPDLFERVLNNLQATLPKPSQAKPIQPVSLRQSSLPAATTAGAAAAISGGIRKNSESAGADTSAEPKDGATAPPSATDGENSPKPQDGSVPKNQAESQAPQKPGNATGSPSRNLPYLTREQLRDWQQKLQSDIASERIKVASEIGHFLTLHAGPQQSLQDRQALTALVIQLLNDPDVVVRDMGIAQLKAGLIRFSRPEARLTPFRQLFITINGLINRKDPLYKLEMHELKDLQNIKRNWVQLTRQTEMPSTSSSTQQRSLDNER